MDRYFYLAAQLPLLQFGQLPAVTRDEFLEEAGKWMTQKDFALIARSNINVLLVFPDDPPLVREYKIFEKDLRSELADWRQARSAQQEKRLVPQLSSLVSEADPLQAETNLLRLRWSVLDQLELGHYFDREFLISFYLKFQILERLSLFDKQKGTEMFDAVCEVTHG